MADLPLEGLLRELRHRKVFRVAVLYAVVAWGVTEVVTTIAPLLRLPDWTPALVLVLLLVGFPVALVLAWAFELTPEGVRRAEAAPDPPAGRWRAARYLGPGAVVALAGFGAYAYMGGPERAASASAGRITSIAVLPFADMSPGKDHEYFSDGLSEELLDALAQIDGLKVPARTSSFAFKGEGVDIRDVGRRLGVQTVLEGSVRKAGERIRITAQLIDAASGYHLWSQTYDRDLTDIFAVQDEISREIVAALRLDLPGGAGSRLVAEHTQDPRAHDLYLKGRYALGRRTAPSIRDAIGLFEQAISIDPGYAKAWAGLADGYLLLPYFAEIAAQPLRERAQAAARRAIELDPGLAEPHATIGLILSYERRFSEAEHEFERALALNPNYATAYQWHGIQLGMQRRSEEALQAARKAYALDPLSRAIAANVGAHLRHAGRLEEAAEHYRSLLQFEEAFADNHSDLAGVYSALGRHEEAVRAARRGAELSGGGARASATLAYVLARAGHAGEAREILARLRSGSAYLAPFQLATVHTALGDTAVALDFVERGVAEEGPGILFAPDLADLRSHPRFQALLERADRP